MASSVVEFVVECGSACGDVPKAESTPMYRGGKAVVPLCWRI